MVKRAKEDFLWFKKKDIVENPQDNWELYLEEVSDASGPEPVEEVKPEPEEKLKKSSSKKKGRR